jgi:hypothetical protein
MEVDFNFLENGRQPQFSLKWKTTSNLSQMEDNLIFSKMEDNLNIWQIKATSISNKIEDGHKIFTNGRQPKLSKFGRQLHYLANRR